MVSTTADDRRELFPGAGETIFDQSFIHLDYIVKTELGKATPMSQSDSSLSVPVKSEHQEGIKQLNQRIVKMEKKKKFMIENQKSPMIESIPNNEIKIPKKPNARDQSIGAIHDRSRILSVYKYYGII